MRVTQDHTRRPRGYYWIRVRHDSLSGNPPLETPEAERDDWQVCYWDDDNETWHPITFTTGIAPGDVEAINEARVKWMSSRSGRSRR